MTPFECVGFPIRGDGDYDAVVPGILDRMMEEAERIPCPAGFEGWSYRDPSGAGLLAFIAKDEAAGTRSLHCLKPAFYGGSRQRARTGRLLEAEECAFCDVAWVEVLGPGDAPAYPAVVRVADPYFRRFSWEAGRAATFPATLFAMSLDPWRGGRGPDGSGRDLAERAFVPSGTFREPPVPEAVVSGRVAQSERRRNALGGGEFVWARIESFAADYDLVAPPDLLPAPPAPGTVLQAGVRVYGRAFKK